MICSGNVNPCKRKIKVNMKLQNVNPYNAGFLNWTCPALHLKESIFNIQTFTTRAQPARLIVSFYPLLNLYKILLIWNEYLTILITSHICTFSNINQDLPCGNISKFIYTIRQICMSERWLSQFFKIISSDLCMPKWD